MTGKNKYLAERDAMRRGFFEAGLESGRQQIIDMVSLVLRDPDIMGKDTFGGARLLKIVKGIGEYIDTYEKAWQKDDVVAVSQGQPFDVLQQFYSLV